MKYVIYVLYDLLVLLVLFAFPVSANFSVSPPYQYVSVDTASEAATINKAYVEFANQTEAATALEFSLAHIQATDVYGRLQFNAPLPQQMIPSDDSVATIEPATMQLEAGQTATVSVTFNPAKIEPGKTAYLLLGKLSQTSDFRLQTSETTVEQYISSTLIVRDPTNTAPKLQLTNFSWPSFPIKFSLPDYLTFYIKNTGTAATPPRGLVQLTDQFNRELYRGAVNEAGSSILPGSERAIYARLTRSNQSFPVAYVTLTGTMYDHEHRFPTTLEKHFLYISPIGLIGLICLIGLILKILPHPTK